MQNHKHAVWSSVLFRIGPLATRLSTQSSFAISLFSLSTALGGCFGVECTAMAEPYFDLGDFLTSFAVLSALFAVVLSPCALVCSCAPFVLVRALTAKMVMLAHGRFLIPFTFWLAHRACVIAASADVEIYKRKPEWLTVYPHGTAAEVIAWVSGVLCVLNYVILAGEVTIQCVGHRGGIDSNAEIRPNDATNAVAVKRIRKEIMTHVVDSWAVRELNASPSDLPHVGRENK